MRTLIKIALFLVIVAAGAAVFMLLSAAREKPARKQQPERPTIVAAEQAAPSDRPVMVTAMGEVVPARQVTVLPEVGGRIVYQSSELVPGGRFAEGELLLRIDPRDYDLAIEQQKAAVSQAELKLAQEQGLKQVAEKEWELIRDQVQPTVQGRKLALREIQLKNAQVAVESARSALDKAQLTRSRTAIRAPFDAVVVEKYVDPGQVVGPGTKVALLADAERIWVQAAAPVEKLIWVRIPGVNSDRGSEVSVVQRAGPKLEIERTGRVIRLLPRLDPKGKMARLLIEVDHPWDGGGRPLAAHAIRPAAVATGGPSPQAEGEVPAAVATPPEALATGLPLFIGAWVRLHIRGPELEGVLRLPRMALRDRSRVWVKSDSDRLEIRDVELVWAHDDIVYVSGDLRPGEQVVTSRMSAPVEGMRIETNGHRSGPGNGPPADEQPDAAAAAESAGSGQE